MSKLFECPEWDCASNTSKKYNFKKVDSSAKGTKTGKISKKKKPKRHSLSTKGDSEDNAASTNSGNPGKFVRIQKADEEPFDAKKSGKKVEMESLRDKLIGSLKGSRFRFINEQLYTNEGKDAAKIFDEDATAFKVYHEGYRQQVSQWPLNPLDVIIKSIRKMPKDYVVGDFGCGDARLAQSVPHKVYSLDLVAANQDVIACDMANTPLKKNSLNVVVYCLSLMGTNLKDFLLEANRVLKMGGLVKIAEVQSRFVSVKEFVKNVEKCGFKLLDKDLRKNYFFFITFKKISNTGKDNKCENFSLKPCLYKKR
uniref:Ribosomal RNA-processing protein 8 n=1 Tax=Lutzomyia longipalpis TaxID=7200 RepID=A0A1B0CXE7_LUTLO